MVEYTFTVEPVSTPPNMWEVKIYHPFTTVPGRRTRDEHEADRPLCVYTDVFTGEAVARAMAAMISRQLSVAFHEGRQHQAERIRRALNGA